MLKTAFEADRALSVTIFVLYVSSQILAALSALAIRLVIDAIAFGDRGDLVTGAVFFGGSLAASLFLMGAMTSMRVTLVEKTNLVVEARLMEILGSAPGVEHFETQEFRDEVEILRLERSILSGAADHLLLSVGMFVSILTSTVLLFSIDPFLSLFPLLALPSLLVSGRGESWRQEAVKTTATDSRLSQELLDVLVSPRSGSELRIYRLGGELLERRARLLRNIDVAMSRATLKSGALSLLAWTVHGGGFALALLYVIGQVDDGNATPGDLLMLITIAARVNSQVLTAARLVSAVFQVYRSVSRYIWIGDHARTLEKPVPTAEAPSRLRQGIRVEGLSFRYPRSPSPVISDVDLFLPAASTVAVVGANGAGKTTLVKLLCGFYEPTAGRIMIDDVPLSSMSIEAWRARLSATFQDFARFELAMRQAVGIGDLTHLDDDDAVQRALVRGAATDVVEKLPDGLDTQLAWEHLEGRRLSEGQWQKVSLARAMMRDPLLLILDEPSSSLDARTEHDLLTRLTAASEQASSVGAIAFVVSHRLSSVRMADSIIVMDGGRIVESGSHQELVEREGLYAEMFTKQSSGYR